jgi:hypothetical protein
MHNILVSDSAFIHSLRARLGRLFELTPESGKTFDCFETSSDLGNNFHRSTRWGKVKAEAQIPIRTHWSF